MACPLAEEAQGARQDDVVPGLRHEEDVSQEGKVTVMATRFERETLERMTVKQLRRLARDHFGDCLGGASRKADVVDEILAQQRARLVRGDETWRR